MKTITAILIGAGGRGVRYSNEMVKSNGKFQIIAVCEPIEQKRRVIQSLWSIPNENCFQSWEEVLNLPKMADLAIITTMDQMHYLPAMKAIEKGYDILLEKPLAQTPEECVNIARAAEKYGARVLVCHVLRYAPFFKKVKELLLSNVIGRITSVVHVEGVGVLHFAHSFVRGNWHDMKETAPTLLAKSCHDIDIIQWLLDKRCKKVQSFGSLSYFTSKNAPEGAPKRCIDGNCPDADTCPFQAKRYYCKVASDNWKRKVINVSGKEYVPTDEEIIEGLRKTDYGLCVFHANNDAIDHQIVNMEFEDGITASFTMNAFNKGGRYIRIFGTEGELFANMSDTEITVYTFRDGEYKKIPIVKTTESIEGGHGGGDAGMIRELYEYLNDDYHGIYAADISVSVDNHLIAFAAEEARLQGSVIDVREYCKKLGYQY